MTRSTVRHAIRWRAPRFPRLRRRSIDGPDLPFVRVRAVPANDALEEAPVTLRDPCVETGEHPARARPAVVDALCAALDVLAAEHLPCELDVVVDSGGTARFYRDPDLAARLMSPFVAGMPEREGLVPIGTIRISGRRVRIYERAV